MLKEIGLHSEAQAASLPSLPIDIIESICSLLRLRGRLCLSTSCHALWTRPDVCGSPVLWGELEVAAPQLATPRLRQSLSSWLERRRAGVRRVRLVLGSQRFKADPGLYPGELLASLAGTSLLRALVLSGSSLAGPASEGRLQHLATLTSLRSLGLAHCSLPQLPPQLPELPQLEALDLRGNALLGSLGRGAAFAPLAGLSALRRLDLADCGLCSIPPQLSTLSTLAELNLSRNSGLGVMPREEFWPLQHLTSLTRLVLGRCCLRALPPQLSSFQSLACLEAWGNCGLLCRGARRGGRLDALVLPLRRLPSLTRLQLDTSMLSAVDALIVMEALPGVRVYV